MRRRRRPLIGASGCCSAYRPGRYALPITAGDPRTQALRDRDRNRAVPLPYDPGTGVDAHVILVIVNTQARGMLSTVTVAQA